MLGYVNAHLFGIIVFITQLFTIQLIRRLMATAQETLDNEKALGTAVGQLIALTDSIKAKLDAATPVDQATIDAINAEIDTTKAAVVDTLTRDAPKV